ncbi:hypothetical protein D9756_010025 [Leucocoprinus leucothites]|uniref:CPL domain-containing protein n=1 Tax=Leucocoprinus leucothites TaxID=201217 RepID=A0A8H5FRZ0_9AGAR|nr:hypothetical protein D9756_010025 [Leucoagaricus leucothites]
MERVRALVYLLTPRSRRHPMPDQIASFEETDTLRAKTSKKDPEARIVEVRKSASGALIQWIAESGVKVVREPRGSLVATEVMLYADGGGHFNKKTHTVEPTDNWDASQFATSFTDTVPQKCRHAMCTEGERNGSFIVATLCETLVKGGDEKKSERQKVKSWFEEKERKIIREGDGRGKDLLLVVALHVQTFTFTVENVVEHNKHVVPLPRRVVISFLQIPTVITLIKPSPPAPLLSHGRRHPGNTALASPRSSSPGDAPMMFYTRQKN